MLLSSHVAGDDYISTLAVQASILEVERPLVAPMLSSAEAALKKGSQVRPGLHYLHACAVLFQWPCITVKGSPP